MSLILKGIDLPKDDDFLSLEIHKNEYRIYYTKGATIREKRGEVIQIPKGHGRLIDADAFVKDFTQNFEECRDVGYFSTEEYARIAEIVASGVTSDINNAPTILEAEE